MSAPWTGLAVVTRDRDIYNKMEFTEKNSGPPLTVTCYYYLVYQYMGEEGVYHIIFVCSNFDIFMLQVVLPKRADPTELKAVFEKV